jgi:hypothetical protein
MKACSNGGGSLSQSKNLLLFELKLIKGLQTACLINDLKAKN